MLMLCSPASGREKRWGPRRRVVGVATSRRPSQLEPRVVCSNWGPAPTPLITISTASGRRRTAISTRPAFAAGTRIGAWACTAGAGREGDPPLPGPA